MGQKFNKLNILMYLQIFSVEVTNNIAFCMQLVKIELTKYFWYFCIISVFEVTTPRCRQVTARGFPRLTRRTLSGTQTVMRSRSTSNSWSRTASHHGSADRRAQSSRYCSSWWCSYWVWSSVMWSVGPYMTRLLLCVLTIQKAMRFVLLLFNMSHLSRWGSHHNVVGELWKFRQCGGRKYN